MFKLQFSREDIFFVVIGLILFIFVAREAWVIPITHDEVSTIVFSQQTLKDIITYADPIPNNHILNTILLKISIGIFGDHPFTDRLPNMLSFIPLFYFTVLTSRVLYKEIWLQFAFVDLICMQPFLLDFFSVTRGYGISVALEMISLYYFFLRLKSPETRNLVMCFVFAALSVYANFTLLNYFIPLGIILGFHSILVHYNTNKLYILKDIGILAGISLILGSLCYLPFTKMMETKQFVYWGSTGFFNDTLVPLLYSLRSGVSYFEWDMHTYGYIFMSVFSILVLAGYVWHYMKNDTSFFTYSLVLLFLVFGYNELQFHLAAVPFLNARTSLFFIPLFSLNLCFGMEGIMRKFLTAGLIIILISASLSVQHYIRGCNIRSTFEWYYDENTYDVLRDLNDIILTENMEKPVKVNCHWIFYPSLSYHVKQKFQGVIELVPYHKEIQPESDARFYFTQGDELEALSARFGQFKDYSWRSRFLLKAK